MKKTVIITILTLLLGGCASQQINDYQTQKPTLTMRQFFKGKLKGWGMFQKSNGTVQKRFVVTIDAKQSDDNVLVLDEQFIWADGTKSERIWRLIEQPDGTWQGSANDVVGKAIGKISGNALHWQYVLSLPVDGKTYAVNFDDWMYLIDDNVMLNRSVMSKWGINLGSVTLSLHRQM